MPRISSVRGSFLGALILVLALVAIGWVFRFPQPESTADSNRRTVPATVTVAQTASGTRHGSSRAQVNIRRVEMTLSDVLSGDPRHIGLTNEEAAWMRRHGYPTNKETTGLDTLDTVPLRGSRDSHLATLHGMALATKGDFLGAAGVLYGATALGSTFAYEEGAIAEYRMGLERFGPSIDSDDILRARLEIAGILGDYTVDALIDKYLPSYPMHERAYYVQRHETVFLGKLGEDALLRGLPIPGPDPRPNAKAWQKLREDAKRDPAARVYVYVLE